MEGMILAAGLGSRLRPLTDHTPKALVPVAGVPMLERVALRLIEAGVDHLIINLHAHADQIHQFVEKRGGFGIDVSFSYETEEPLDTGGGLKRARPLFREKGDFLLHNVDVLSDVRLTDLLAFHRDHQAVATLAVRPNDDAARYLLRSNDDRFCGYGSASGQRRICRPCTDDAPGQRVDFCGIHVLHTDVFDAITEEGVFSIIYVYARLAESGAQIRTYDVSDAWWLDVGTHERLAMADAHYGSPSTT